MPIITSQPTTTRHNPVGSLDCLRYLINAPEGITANGDFPAFSIVVSAANQVVGNTMVIFGKTYTVSATVTDKDNVQLTSGTALQKAVNIQKAINANQDIYPFVASNIFNVSGTITLTCTWYRKEVFGGGSVYSNGTLATPYTISSLITGAAFVMVDGFKIAYQLLAGSDYYFRPVTQLRAAPIPILNFDDQALDLDFQNVAAGLVRTTEPFLNLVTFPYLDTSIRKKVKLRAGSVVSTAGNPSYGDFIESREAYVINSAVGMNDNWNAYDFISLASPTQRFLTQRPRKFHTCNDSYQWLYFVANATGFITGLGGTVSNYFVEIKTYSSETALATTIISDIADTDGVWIIPCGTAQLALSNAYKYTVQFGVVHDSGGRISTMLSEVFTFYVDKKCCADMYREWHFLEPIGGYGSLIPYESSSETKQDSGAYVQAAKKCDSTADRTRGGLSKHSGSSFERITMKFRERQDDAMTNYVNAARTSQRGYVRVVRDGITTWQKFVPDDGAFSTKVVDGFLEFEVTGSLSHELATLKDVNLVLTEI